MEQRVGELAVDTAGRGLVDITRRLKDWVAEQRIGTGLLTLWCRHTSASLIVQENASPEVRTDLEDFLQRLVPDGGGARYRHDEEGPDDMPAHIRAVLTSVQLSIPIRSGRPALGTWQAVYLYEHRLRPHRRMLDLHLIGEGG
ncbi:secondary thiamine-phosphate synthase enzyme [Roseomonas rosea]|uniref:Secondary thiamine-phosphate synthase enzyme n=1 Tax=Muricoccus roseus TaxID=198092 RepID=A0A1M6ESV5_9PROT|nr:secondary thiamine-phosphate synthase enzyme YjbQ [Roseomonas rosea]SHI88604.1 secondary thiamine-phosphate synthase enzyme [Roseomonas rosea]